MTPSEDALWLLEFIDDAPRGASGKALVSGSKGSALQELVDGNLIKADEKGLYWLTRDGQAFVAGGAA